MLPTIIIISIAFCWLLIETNFLRIRLLYGAKPKPHTLLLPAAKPVLMLPEAHKPIDMTVPYWWKNGFEKQIGMELCQRNYNCPYKTKCKKSERWVHWQISKRTIKAFGHTMNFERGCNIYRALLLKDIVRELKRKPSQLELNFPTLPLITYERIDSHREQVGMIGNRRHFEAKNDYKTVYHDSLVSKEWLEAHINDKYPEPLIEITVDGGKSFSVDGNYKKGLIEDFVNQYTTKVRIGRKSVKIDNGVKING